MLVLYTYLQGVPRQSLEVWDVETAEQSQASASSTLAAVHVDVSSDGTGVVSSHADQQIQAWDLAGDSCVCCCCITRGRRRPRRANGRHLRSPVATGAVRERVPRTYPRSRQLRFCRVKACTPQWPRLRSTK